MTRYTKLLIFVMTAAMTLAFGVGTASALRSLSLEGEGGRTTLTLNQRALEFKGTFGNIRCDTTMVKTVSRVIPKVERTLMGRVTDVRIANCRGSFGVTVLRVTVLRITEPELWRIFYKSFTGTLPRPTGYINEIQHTQVLIDWLDFSLHSCLYDANVTGTVEVEAGGSIGRLRSRETIINTITDLTGAGCEPNSAFEARELTPLQRVRINLI